MTEIKMTSNQRLFATPLFTFQVAGFEDLNRRLMVDINQWRAESPGIDSSNRLGWHSDRTLFGRSEPSFRELNKLISKAVMAATQNANPSMAGRPVRMMMQGWVNINEKGAFNTPHDHPEYMWSGCYYVKVPGANAVRSIKNSGDIEFIDPRGGSPIPVKNDIYIGSAKHRVCPEPGMLLIFPSTLMHWVYPHEDDEGRVSIAFNMKFMRGRAKESAPPA